MKTKRVDIRVPVVLLEKIENYQVEKSITTRSAAMLELMRYGLDEYENKNKK